MDRRRTDKRTFIKYSIREPEENERLTQQGFLERVRKEYNRANDEQVPLGEQVFDLSGGMSVFLNAKNNNEDMCGIVITRKPISQKEQDDIVECLHRYFKTVYVDNIYNQGQHLEYYETDDKPLPLSRQNAVVTAKLLTELHRLNKKE